MFPVQDSQLENTSTPIRDQLDEILSLEMEIMEASGANEWDQIWVECVVGTHIDLWSRWSQAGLRGVTSSAEQ